MGKLLSVLKSPWVLLVAATLMAAGVAYAAYLYLGQREARMKDEMIRRAAAMQGPKTAVIVPRADARVGTPIEQDVFVARKIDADLVYPDTVAAKDFEAIRGQKLARPLQKGRPLRLSDLQTPEVKDVSSILPPGTRAVTIEIDDINSIAQTLRPGHRVDVFLVTKFEPPKGVELSETGRQQVTMFMQNLQVIAAGREFQSVDPEQQRRTEQMARPGDTRLDGRSNFDTVTVLVTPAEVQRLLVGGKVGSYRVALRGKQDDAKVNVAPLLAASVLPRGPRPEPPVEIIVGGKTGGGQGALSPTMLPQMPAMPHLPQLARAVAAAAAAGAGAAGVGGDANQAADDAARVQAKAAPVSAAAPEKTPPGFEPARRNP